MGNKTTKPQGRFTTHCSASVEYEEFKDPITNKIMLTPTMILSSMQVYDDLTIKKWIESKRNFDPITGFPVAINGWPLLLQKRPDIKQRIDRLLEEYPSLKTKQMHSEDDQKLLNTQPIEWETLFKAQDEKVKQRYDEITADQAKLRKEAKQIFKTKTANEVSEAKEQDMVEINYDIVYDDTIILQPDIPVVCIMGPSRNGKSTIVNDILGVENACKISTKPNVPVTKGAWIARYSSQKNEKVAIDDSKDDSKDEKKEVKPDEFYLLDMQGLSHNVTKFTKRLFYACYATANVIVWNDKNVASDEFKNLMEELQTEMKAVAKSKKKPAFLYLKRDAGDYDYEPFDTFDDYISKDASFLWFREMNVFSSVSAYELERPFEDKNVRGLNFHSLERNQKLLPPLIKTIVKLSKTGPKFAENMFILKQQICHINESTALNMTMQYVQDNDILKLFILPPKGTMERRRDMVFAACELNWNHKKIDKQFTEEMKKMKDKISAKAIDNLVVDRLNSTKKELYERVKNKQEIDKFGKYVSTTGAVLLGIAGAVGGGAIFAATIVTGGMVVLVAGGLGLAGAAIGWAMGKGAQKGRERYKEWTKGNYMKYTLGRTDKEHELDGDKVDDISIFSTFEYWDAV